MMNKRKIGFDCDEVLFELFRGYLTFLRKKYKLK